MTFPRVVKFASRVVVVLLAACMIFLFGEYVWWQTWAQWLIGPHWAGVEVMGDADTEIRLFFEHGHRTAFTDVVIGLGLLSIFAVAAITRCILAVGDGRRPGITLSLWLVVLIACFLSLAPTHSQYARLTMAVLGPGYWEFFFEESVKQPNNNKTWPLFRQRDPLKY